MEYKSLPSFIKSIEGRQVAGVFAVHGNIDSYGDISHPGSFTKTIAERMGRIKFLWNHDFYGGPPTAVVKTVREIGRDELPDSVLSAAPEATGGVEVVREYLDTPRADEVFQAVKAGAVNEMSYGLDAVKFDFSEMGGQQIRNLREIRLWEVSDVIFGANPATQASKFLPPLDLLLKQVEARMEELKAGARHSSADTKLLNAIHKAAVELGATQCKGIASEDESASQEQSDGKDDKANQEKSQADALSLTLLRARAFLLDLSAT